MARAMDWGVDDDDDMVKSWSDLDPDSRCQSVAQLVA